MSEKNGDEENGGFGELLTAEDSDRISRALAIPGAQEVALPEIFKECRALLEKCSHLDEVTSFMTKIEQVAVAARAAHDDSLIELALRIRNEAKRKLGLLLSELPIATAAAMRRSETITEKRAYKAAAPNAETRYEAARAVGLNASAVQQALAIAGIPEDVFQAANNRRGSIPTSGLINIARALKSDDAPRAINEEAARNLLRQSAIRAVAAFADFTKRHPAKNVAICFPTDRAGVARSARTLIDWLERFILELGERPR